MKNDEVRKLRADLLAKEKECMELNGSPVLDYSSAEKSANESLGAENAFLKEELVGF